MLKSLALIVVVELCERIGYYTIVSTKKSWLQDQGYSNSESSTLAQIFSVFVAVSCLFGGWLADTRVGRYRAIAALVTLYVIGCLLTAGASFPAIENVPLYFVGTYGLVALGSGGVKPNVCNFGADQLDSQDLHFEQRQSSFFLYFFLTINIGQIIAYGFCSTLATNGLPPLVPKEDGYFVAYSVSACFMLVALACFLAGTRFYTVESFRSNSEGPLAHIVERLWSGGRRNPCIGMVALTGWLLMPVFIVMTCVSAFVSSIKLTMLTFVVAIVSIGCLCCAHRDNSWIGKDDVTKTLDCVPVLLVGNTAFYIMYNTMGSLFYSQACQMDTRLGSSLNAPQLNGAALSLAHTVATIIFTPLIASCGIPCAEKILRQRVTLNMKIYLGIGIAIGSQLAAMALEHARRSTPSLDIGSFCAPLQDNTDDHVHMSAMSVFWMAIPIAMIGIGEVFVYPTMQQYAYEGAAPSMRSLLQALNQFANLGLPSAFSAVLNEATASLTPNDLNDGNLSRVYGINVLIGLIGCALYYWVSTQKAKASVTKPVSANECSCQP